MSVIEVECPHCGARGQILPPPLGAVVMGPCPQCYGLVAVFCGKALALDRDVMHHGSTTEKREHLLSALTAFLEERVNEVVAQLEDERPDRDDAEAEPEGEAAPALPAPRAAAVAPISPVELDEFVHVDLPRLDDIRYFRAIFG